MATVAFGVGVFFYLVAFVELYCSSHPRRLRVLSGFCFALVAHAVTLAPSIITKFGLNFNLFNSLSLSALFFVGYFVLFCLYRPILSLGLLASPVAILGLMAGFFGKASYEPLFGVGRVLEVHILLSFAAYCALFMACMQAVILLAQIKELKQENRHRYWVAKLPSLQTMEGLLFDMILLGFVLLSIALTLGGLATYDLLAQHIAHKFVFSLLSWVIFGAFILGHYRYGWQGKRACHMTFAGFALLALGFMGSKVVLELIIG